MRILSVLLALAVSLFSIPGLCDEKAEPSGVDDAWYDQHCSKYLQYETATADIEEAKKCWKLDCDRGHARGCYFHGWSEQREGNRTEAERAFRLACEGRVAGGCKEVESIEDREALRKAHGFGCKNGDLNDCYELARIEEALSNLEAAKELWKNACDGGEQRSCKSLQGLTEEKEQETRCLNGDYKACYDAGYRVQNKGNNGEAAEYFRLSCQGGYAVACRFYGQLKQRNDDTRGARAYLTRACELKDAFSCWLVGELEEGLGNTEDAKKAYRLACEGVDGWTGCLKLGILEEAAGNIEEAKKAYEKHCKHGPPDCGGCEGPNQGCSSLEALNNR